ncbi:MAG: NAD(P)H-dependent glycerol-3-phosphate dehydrogenase [Chitinophagaceae bacterium]
MKFGMIGSGSWATALTKILTDNRQTINWWIRTESVFKHINQRHHNPNYLSSVYFDPAQVNLQREAASVIWDSDIILIAIPSAFVQDTLGKLSPEIFEGKKVVSAVKGMLPQNNLLLNDYLELTFNLQLKNYFTLMGPCHAEEVAAEKLSYLTFSGLSDHDTFEIAKCFQTDYLNIVVNYDIIGVQYAAVLKNIYALGAGIAHGLDYGDNFLSVLIANSADEMAGFLKKVGIRNIEVGIHANPEHESKKKTANYAASVYLGDLLVTCYSLFSRNRTFGNMIGKGYSIRAAQMELNMVAEGFNASKCIHVLNQEVKAEIPIVDTVYRILWEHLPAAEGFKQMEESLV